MNRLPQVTRNILIINILVYIITQLRPSFVGYFALFNPVSPMFHLWQPLTYMFLHGGFWHIFMNMFVLVMFAPQLESIWGSRKFLTFYLVTGVGAGMVQMLVEWLSGSYIPTVGASGAVYGLLMGYAMLFPDSRLMLIFPPIALKAKWWVLIWIVIELMSGFLSDGVAHFAHLGGMLFGFVLITIWKKKGTMYDYYDYDE